MKPVTVTPALTLLALAMLAAACARPQGPDVEPAAVAAVPESVFVEVVNDNYYDARIHLIYEGGARHSLGTIAGNRRQFVGAVPWQPRGLQVEVMLIIGGGVYRSDRIDAAPGDLVEVRVPPNIESSVFFRRVAG